LDNPLQTDPITIRSKIDEIRDIKSKALNQITNNNNASFNQSRIKNINPGSKRNLIDIPQKNKITITIKASDKKIIKLENVKEKPKSLIDITTMGNNTINKSIFQNTVDLGKDISKNINIINNSDSKENTRDNIYSFANLGSSSENFYFFS